MSLPGIQISERDISLFQSVQRFGLLSLNQIHQTHFPDTSPTTTARRLKKLVDHGFLRRYVVPGYAEYFYHLGDEVRGLVADDTPKRRIRKAQLRHDVELAGLMLHLAQSYPGEELKTEAELHAMGLNATSGPCPDGAVHYAKRALYLLEYDRGTEWGGKLRQKLAAYEGYFRSNSFRADFGNHLAHFRVLLVCQQEQRIEQVFHSLQDAPALPLLVFATTAEVHASQKPLHDAIWQHCEKDGPFALVRA